MYRITMTVHHGRTYEGQGESPRIQDAFDDLMDSPLGVGYGPKRGTTNYDNVLDALASEGVAQLGWADYVMEVV